MWVLTVVSVKITVFWDVKKPAASILTVQDWHSLAEFLVTAQPVSLC